MRSTVEWWWQSPPVAAARAAGRAPRPCTRGRSSVACPFGQPKAPELNLRWLRIQNRLPGGSRPLLHRPSPDVFSALPPRTLALRLLGLHPPAALQRPSALYPVLSFVLTHKILISLPSPSLPTNLKMFAKASALLALAAAASPALATIYVTSPVASTSWTAGTQQTITWEDDGTSPSLSDFGTASVGVYVGSQISQVSFPFPVFP